MSTEEIRVHYVQLDTIAGTFRDQAEQIAQMQQALQRGGENLRQGGWSGAAANAFYDEMDSEVLPAIRRLVEALRAAQTTTLQIKVTFQQAEEEAAAPFNERFGQEFPLDDGFVPPVPLGIEERRTDRRVDRRIDLDERWRRSPGNTGADHFDYDWAGGAILERYLTGGSDWHIYNDPRWTEYMQANESLTGNLRERAISTAQELLASGSTEITIDESFPMEMENGEGIVGYQYLHGTNQRVGGFQRQGTANLEPDGNGGYIATMDLTYTWNDIIDPNPQYSTDQWKSRFAELITLGRADPYNIHISWSERTIVHIDANGNITSIRNS